MAILHELPVAREFIICTKGTPSTVRHYTDFLGRARTRALPEKARPL